MELKAALFALKSFTKEVKDCEIILRMDNTTAVAYVNRMGGVQHSNLHKITKEIWQWCEARNIWLVASYIKSQDNIEADRESRIKNIDTEWELADYAFRQAVKVFGYPEIDLFAARCNAKCKKFVSWGNDPEALAVDAFTMNWNLLGLLWIFPPFALILKVLKKLVTDEATGIVVVPYWTSQPWFPLYMKLLTLHFLLLSLFCRSIQHPLAGRLSLMVSRLSGNLSEEKDYLIHPSTSSKLH